MSGEVADGDNEQLIKLLFAGKIEDRILVLDSPGGSLFEGIGLAITVNWYGFRTVIPADAKCLSACFLIYAAGELRLVADGGQLGMHQFYGGAENRESDLFTVGMMMDSLARSGVDTAALTDALRTSPDEMHIYSREELQKYRLIKAGDGKSFAASEAARLRLTLREFKRRRAALLASPKLQRCWRQPEEGESLCLQMQIWAHKLKR